MQQVLCFLAVESVVAQVNEHQVNVGTAGGDRNAGVLHVLLQQAVRQDLRTLNGALLTVLERLRCGNLERGSLRRNHVHERAALLTGEHCGVNLLLQLLGAEDEAGTGTAQSLVHGRGNHVRVRDGVRVQTRSHQTREVSHVHPQVCADFVSNRTERSEVQLTGVRGPAGNNQLGALGKSQFTHLLHVNAAGLVHAVRHNVVQLAGDVQLHAVGQVATVRQRQTHDGVAGVQQCVHDGVVRLRTGVGLNVGVLGAEEFLHAGNSEGLNDVNEFAAAVVAAAGVTLSVLVGQYRALAFEDGTGDEVLGCNHLEGVLLALALQLNGFCNLGVEVGEGHLEDLLLGHYAPGSVFALSSVAHHRGCRGVRRAVFRRRRAPPAENPE